MQNIDRTPGVLMFRSAKLFRSTALRCGTNERLLANQSVLMVFDKQQKRAVLIDFTISSDVGIRKKEHKVLKGHSKGQQL